MDATTRLKLEELRKVAFLRLKGDKRMVNRGEAGAMAATIVGYTTASFPKRISIGDIMMQMRRDLRIYPIYDCLAMWLDPDAGLAHYAPDLMIQVATVMI